MVLFNSVILIFANAGASGASGGAILTPSIHFTIKNKSCRFTSVFYMFSHSIFPDSSVCYFFYINYKLVIYNNRMLIAFLMTRWWIGIQHQIIQIYNFRQTILVRYFNLSNSIERIFKRVLMKKYWWRKLNAVSVGWSFYIIVETVFCQSLFGGKILKIKL